MLKNKRGSSRLFFIIFLIHCFNGIDEFCGTERKKKKKKKKQASLMSSAFANSICHLNEYSTLNDGDIVNDAF